MISIKGLDDVMSKSFYIVAYIDGNAEMDLSSIFYRFGHDTKWLL